MWQFAEATRGLADGCLQLGIPVTGGNVSFYNQTGDVAINPTPVVGVLGVIADVARRTPIAWGSVGGRIYVLGDTHDEFGGSEWAHHVHGHLGGLPPAVDLERERVLGEVLVAGSLEGLLTAAHDGSDGGIAQVLVEMALASNAGGRCSVPDGVDPFTYLFSESTGRAVVVVPPESADRLLAMCAERGLPAAFIGVVDGSDSLEFTDLFTASLAELREAHEGTLPRLFG